MNKFMKAALASVMGLSLVGCGSSSSTSSKTYIIATDKTYAPFEMTDKKGKLIGLDMDLMRAIAKNQNFKIKINSLGFDATPTPGISSERTTWSPGCTGPSTFTCTRPMRATGT